SSSSRDGDERATLLRGFWYVVARSRELGRRPLERRALGERLALFRDEHGVARVVSARCPHRGANLAAGRVVGGCLECPYHGWRFDGDGHCAAIPSQPAGSAIPPGFAVRAFP